MNGEKEVSVDVLKLSLAFQFSLLSAIGLESIGIHIPLFRELVATIYLTIIPGLLTLGLLKKKLDLTKTVLFSIGMSFAIVTFVSAFINVFLASFGFERPLSERILFISLSIVILLLLIICYLKGERYLSFSYNPSFSPATLLLALFSFISIIASYESSFYERDFLVLLFLGMIALIPFVISSGKFPERLYPPLILSISISLAFLRYGRFLFKPTSFGENGLAGVIKLAGIWIPNFASTHNSLLYPTLLPSVFSTLLGIDTLCGIAVIGFLISIFLPLIIYEIYTTLFDRKVAALASFLFLFYPFYHYLLGSRDGFAIFFLALFFLTLFSEEMTPATRNILLIVFAFSIIVSHYGNAYFFMLLLFVAAAVAFISREKTDLSIPAFCFLYFALTLTWYIYTSSSVNVKWAIGYGKNVYDHLSEFLTAESSAALKAMATTWSFAQEVTKYLIIANSLFIALGIIELMYLAIRNGKHLDEYSIFAIAFSLGLIILILPRIMGAPRVYLTLLVILSPFSFLGFSLLLRSFYRILARKGSYLLKEEQKRATILFSVFLSLLLIFGSGFVSTVVSKVNGETFDPRDPARWFPSLNEYDIAATEWFLHCNGGGKKMYLDSILSGEMVIREGEIDSGYPNFPLEYGGVRVYEMEPFTALPIKDYLDGKKIEDAYIYLGYHNTVYDFMGVVNEAGERIPLKTSDYMHSFEKNSRIYDNTRTLIYYIS